MSLLRAGAPKGALACAVLLAGVLGCQDPAGQIGVQDQLSLGRLWRATVGPYLTSRLWTDGEAYDAGHYLMVPLHAAFRCGYTGWQDAFADQFDRFAKEWVPVAATSDNRLGRLQYEYLAAEFLTLAAPSGRTLVPAPMPGLLQAEIKAIWEQTPSWQWGRDPFPGGMRERLLWKLSTPPTSPSYYRAVVDEELLVMAIAADLRRYARDTGWTGLDEKLVDEILAFAVAVFRQRVAWQGSGWLFQPGLWADHPDFAYAGQTSVSPDMLPAPLPDVAEDVSHSHRLPLWLHSLAAGWPFGSPERRYFEQLNAGLAAQFVRRVLRWPVPDTMPITTSNYMDGRDGLYRWNYVTLGPGRGYGPSQLSGTLTLGWWAFLGVPESAALYTDLAARFPLDSATVALYVGPNTTRIRNSLVALPAVYSNGMIELLVRLAAALQHPDTPAPRVPPLPTHRYWS